MVETLLADQRVDVNKADRSDCQADCQGTTPLYEASRMGHVDVVKTLLADQRVNVNQPNIYGATPLFILSTVPSYHPTRQPSWYDQSLEVVKLLLADPRMDPNKLATSYGNPNAISVAVRVGNLEVVRLLLRCPKVLLGVKDLSGKSELDYAKLKSPGVPDELKLQIVEAIESRQTLLEQGHTC